mmetsp:Transcript_61950/g.183011  ORF Transcript_61950/g.183011 Transcript_61950/m.183011 type:complete len:260 (+) Transcript_61950:1192-1971(+)
MDTWEVTDASSSAPEDAGLRLLISRTFPRDAFDTARRAAEVTSGSASWRRRCTNGMRVSSMCFLCCLNPVPSDAPAADAPPAIPSPLDVDAMDAAELLATNSSVVCNPTRSVNSSPLAVARLTRTAALGSFSNLIATGSMLSNTFTLAPGLKLELMVPLRTESTRRGTHKVASARTRSSASPNKAWRRSMMTENQCSPSALQRRSHWAATASRTGGARSSARRVATGSSLHCSRYTSKKVGSDRGGNLLKLRLPFRASP